MLRGSNAGPEFELYNTLSQGISQPPNYQVKQGNAESKKLGTANSSDLNFMLGPKQGGAIKTLQS